MLTHFYLSERILMLEDDEVALFWPIWFIVSYRKIFCYELDT